MKLGVLGPPGVGKTKFANRMAKELDLKVIDGYVQRLQKDTGLALGPWAAYVENFMVAGERMKQEERFKDQNTITCGTIVDSLMYAMVHSDSMLHAGDLDHRKVAYMQAQNAMQAMSMWYTEIWDYHLAFVLDWPNHTHQTGWEFQYRSYLPAVLESFAVPGVVRLQGTLDEQVKVALEVVKLATAEEESTDEASVPSSE